MKEHFHIIWPSFGTYQVWDNRGHWWHIASKYEHLRSAGIHIYFQYELPNHYLQKQFPSNQRRLQAHHIDFLKTQIKELCGNDGDRVAGQLDIRYINCQETYVELFVSEEESILKKKLARIKSRTATLLSFEFPNEFEGRNTWGKGIWTSKITGDIQQATSILQNPKKPPMK